MKNRFRLLLSAAFIAGGNQASAVINDGTKNEPSELFISVLDPDADAATPAPKSYYKDLGVSLTSFRTSPVCGFNLADDSNYASFLGKTGLIYNVAGFYGLKPDRSNLAQWGYLLTSRDGAGIFRPSFVSIDAVRQKMQVYAFDLNPAPYDGSNGTENLSEAFTSDKPGYFDGADWGANLGGTVGGSTAGRPDQALDFYYVTNPTGAAADGTVTKQGSWTLSDAGQLSYASSTVQASCAKPVAAIAGGNRTVPEGSAVTLDGSGSSDSDGTVASYQWTQLAGDATRVTLTGATTATAGFTAPAADAGDVVLHFQLVVTDNSGLASDPAGVSLTVHHNAAPSASAHADPAAIDPGATVSLVGSGSDTDGTIASYSWTQTAGPSVELTTPTAATAGFTAPDVASRTTLGFQLKVTDNEGATDTADVSVTVNGPSLELTAPASWVLGQKQALTWTSGAIGQTRRVAIRYSLDGSTYKPVKSATLKAGQFDWAPKRKHVGAASLQVCVKPKATAAEICDSQEITVADQVPGAAITLTTPASWTVGASQSITWTTAEIGDKQAVTVSFAKDGVRFKPLKKVRSTVGTFSWKPSRKQATANGVLQVCVKANPLVQPVCDTQDGVNVQMP